MARLNVNPTRIMLSSLKKKLSTYVRGHKLLKDKRDGLMKDFIELARENEKLRKEVEEKLARVHASFDVAAAVMSQEVLEEALMYPKQGVILDVKGKNVMSVDIPVFNFKTTASDPTDIYPYGYANTSGDLDGAVEALSEVFQDMLKLAEVEKACQLMAVEIEKTRRRVNALEYKMIPDTQETIKYISQKLDENERSTQIRLMKVKDMILEEAHHYKEKMEMAK